jgi:hypothetical protein
LGGVIWWTAVQVGLGKKREPIQKITNVKRSEGVAQVVEYMHSKCEVLMLKHQYCHKNEIKKDYIFIQNLNY